MKRLGVDVGGTFTDLIYVDDDAGTILVHKVADDSRGSVSGHRAGNSRARAKARAPRLRSWTRSSTARRSPPTS